MAFKKSALPTERAIVPEGTYTALVKQVHMRVASTGNNTLNMLLQTPKGQLWDMISESQNQNALFKLNQLIKVTTIEKKLKDEFELDDLAPLLVGKSFGIQVVHQTDQKNVKRAVVGFNDSIYMTAAELQEAIKAEAQIAAELEIPDPEV